MNYTKHSKVDFTIYDYTQLGPHVYTLSATVTRKVELSLIWAQVTLCKLATGAVVTRY